MDRKMSGKVGQVTPVLWGWLSLSLWMRGKDRSASLPVTDASKLVYGIIRVSVVLVEEVRGSGEFDS